MRQMIALIHRIGHRIDFAMDTPRRTLDRIDFAILQELRNDGRLSNKELAHRIGLAPSSCLARFQRLQADGVITGFRAEISVEALGVGLQSIISVQLDQHGLHAIEKVRDRLAALPEVSQLFHVGGSQDLLVHVGVTDPGHLLRFVTEHLSGHDDVKHIETALLFEHLRSSVLPLPPETAT